MSKPPIKVLLVEDNPIDAQVIQDLLANEKDGAFELQYADRLSVALKFLGRGGVDIVLLDLQLPDCRGFDTLIRVLAQAPRVPIVVLTASDDEGMAAQALQKGAQDYLVKGYIQVYPHLLRRSMRYAIERQRAEEEVRHAHEQNESLLSSITSILIGVDANGVVTHWNEVAEQTFDIPAATTINRPLLQSGIKWDSLHVDKLIDGCRDVDRPWRLDEVSFTRPDGQRRFLGVTITPIKGHQGERSGFLLFGADITERKLADEERARLQEQLVQAQKMETIGRFAGNIAHDFNNFLQVILSFTSLIRSQRQQDEPLLRDLNEINHAAETGSAMVRQLMAFSRRQPLKPRVFELNQMVRKLARLLEQLVGDKITVLLDLAEIPLMVRVDPTGMEQIIMNLAANARDAMEHLGTLTVCTRRFVANEAFIATHSGVKPSAYVQLVVRDTGTGMSPEVAARIFEPFFTTKKQGMGTGLGLAVVYGLVRQHEGFIDVETAPGRGTAFQLYFPQQMAEAQAAHGASAPAGAASGSGANGNGHDAGKRKLLIVDDDSAVRSLCQRILQESYEISTAGNGVSAMETLLRDHFDLLLTDLHMPNMDGFALIEEIAKAQPQLKVMAMTGTFTDEVEERLQHVSSVGEVLRKPFTPTVLQNAVQRCLANGSSAEADH